MEQLKYFEAFAGVGGFSLGIERAYETIGNLRPAEQVMEEGLDLWKPVCRGSDEEEQRIPTCVGFSEIDKYASAVLRHNYPNIKNYGNIEEINWSEVPDFDLLTGGSPCQDFSIAGKRAGLEGQRSGLFREYLRALEEKQPKYFIWENVKGVLSSRSGWDFANIQSALSKAGYSLWWQVLNAEDFGVPQNRERIFVVGFREGSPREVFFEAGNDGETIGTNGGTRPVLTPDRLKKRQNGRRFKEDGEVMFTLTGQDKHGIVQLNNPTHSNDRVYSEDGISPTLNTMQGGRRQPFVKVPEATKKGYAIAEEGDSINLSVPHSKTRRGRVGKGIAQTLDTGMQQHTLQGTRIRRLTPTECSRLMSWPDDWCKYGNFDGEIKEISDSQKYKMCGNGVVSEVVKHVVKELIL